MATEHRPYLTPDLTHVLATKPFFKIGEVAKIIGVKPHVLRYWESEFPSLRPKKNPSGQRIYAKVDIETLVEIKNLLYNERYTISGARQMLARQEDVIDTHDPKKDVVVIRTLTLLKDQIHELIGLMDEGMFQA